MYLMNCLAARGREHDALRAMRSVRNAEEARQAVSKGLPESVAAVFSPGELERLRVRLRALPEPPTPDHAWRATTGLARPASLRPK
jgi:hypothetical protein